MPIDRRRREQNRKTILSMLETTPATVARPYGPSAKAEEIPDLDFDWRPRPMEKAIGARRSYRWSIILSAAALGAAALIGLQFLVKVPQEKADARRLEYATAIGAFSDAVEALAGAPTPSEPAALAEFRREVEEFVAVAEAPLPSVLPLLPIGPIEDLRPGRAEMLAAADSANALLASLTGAAAYREAAAGLITVPLLPSEAPPELIDPAARAIADMQTIAEASLRSMDDDPAFAAFRERAVTAVESLPEWADRYLLALRRGDVEEAVAALADLQGRADLLSQELDTALVEMDAAATATLADIRQRLERAIIELG